MRSRMENIEATWSGLPQTLMIQGTDPLYSSMRPAVQVNDEYVDAVIAAADAVDDFATTVAGLQSERDTLAGEITSLRAAEAVSDASVQADGLVSGMSPALIETQAGQVRGQVADLVRRFEEAEDDCVRALTRIEDGYGHLLAPAMDAGRLGVATASGMPAWSPAQDRFQQAMTDRTMKALTALGTMTEAEQRAWLANRPEFADTLAELPPPPNAVAAWWTSLGSSAVTASPGQLALIASVPAVIGNLTGVAYWGRDRANRNVLTERASRLEMLEQWLQAPGDNNISYVERRGEWLTQLDQHGYDEASFGKALDNTREIQRALGLATARPPRMLISLDDSSPSLAAIAIGDLDTASHATYLVSGMYSSTNDMTGAVNEARALHTRQVYDARWNGVDADVATVAWIGYESPDAVTVIDNDHAEVGAELLARELAGYTASQDARGAAPYLTVGAHSYGSTVSMLALREDIGVDAFAMYGTAGAHEVDNVNDLEVPTGQVYVTETSDDPLAPIGRFFSGRDHPATDLFGARKYGSDGDGTDPVTGEKFTESGGHSEYLMENSEGLRNLAYIGLGRGNQVTEE